MQVQEGHTPYVSVVSENITFMVQEAHLTDDFNAKHYLEKWYGQKKMKHVL
jgi:hypothetical protein